MDRAAGLLFAIVALAVAWNGSASAQLPVQVPTVPSVPLPPPPPLPLPIQVPTLAPPPPPPPSPPPPPPPPPVISLPPPSSVVGAIGSVVDTATGALGGSGGGSGSGGLTSGGSGSGGLISGGSGSGGLTSGGSGSGGLPLGGSGPGGLILGGSGSGGSGAGGSASGAGGAASAADAGWTAEARARPRRDRQIRATEQAISNTGPRKQRRAALIRFTLERAAIVRFVVLREWPNCVRVGSFTVRGKAGLNTFRFRGRIGGEPLPAGTYALYATAIRGARRTSLGRTKVVVLAPGASRRRARPAPSVCDAGVGASLARGPSGDDVVLSVQATAGGRAAREAVASTEAGGRGEGEDIARAAATSERKSSARDGRVLGVLPYPFEGLPVWLQPLLLSALALAILALTAAALPMRAVRPAGAAPVVERRRTEFALAGAVLLATVAVTALLV